MIVLGLNCMHHIPSAAMCSLPSPCTMYEHRWSKGTYAGEVIAAALPHTHVYKAFNTVGCKHMRAADGSRLGSPTPALTMTMIGGAEVSDARAVAEAVVGGVGFSPRYVGPIRYARNLEAMAELWVHGGGVGSRNFHFQVVGKP